MKKVTSFFAFFVLLLTQIGAQSPLLSTTISNAGETDYGHYSIVQAIDASQEPGQNAYVLAGTKYLDTYTQNSAIDVLAMDADGNVIMSLEYSHFQEGFINPKCYRMNRKGQNGNYLLIGSIESNLREHFALIVELDAYFNVVHYGIFQSAEMSNMLAFDAQFFFNEGEESLERGYVIVGMEHNHQETNLELLERTNKQAFYMVVREDLRDVHYTYYINGLSDIDRDNDYLNRVEFITSPEGNAQFVMSGSKTVGSIWTGLTFDPTHHLLITVDVASGAINWEFNKFIAQASNLEIIADFVYDPDLDALHVGYSTHEPAHIFGLLSINEFSTNKTIGQAKAFSPGAYGSNAWISKMQMAPKENPADPTRIVAHLTLYIDYDPFSCQPGRKNAPQNVLSAISEFEYDPGMGPGNSTWHDQSKGFRFKPSLASGWPYSYNLYLSSMQADKPPRCYSNTFCQSVKFSFDEPIYTMAHYRTDLERVDLEVYEDHSPTTPASLVGEECLKEWRYHQTLFETVNPSVSIQATPHHIASVATSEEVSFLETLTEQVSMCGSNRRDASLGPCYFPIAPHALRKAVSGTKETTTNELSVFPNPSNGSFQLSFTPEVYGTLQVYNLTGKLIFQVDLTEGIYQYDLDLTDVADGVYLIKLVGNQVQTSEKVSKL